MFYWWGLGFVILEDPKVVVILTIHFVSVLSSRRCFFFLGGGFGVRGTATCAYHT